MNSIALCMKHKRHAIFNICEMSRDISIIRKENAHMNTLVPNDFTYQGRLYLPNEIR